MPQQTGRIEALFRYPVKSMAGESLSSIEMGWNGFEGDRRFALHKSGDTSAFPWLTATRFASLITFRPERDGNDAPTHVSTPEGRTLPIFGEELTAEIEARSGIPVEMVQYKNGIFDDASISVIATATIDELGRQAGLGLDVSRFRPNILVRLNETRAFAEDGWLGTSLAFGEGESAPTIAVTMRDVRCAMINLDPDTAEPATEVMKAAVRANENCAGVYATVTRIGRLEVGQPVFLRRD